MDHVRLDLYASDHHGLITRRAAERAGVSRATWYRWLATERLIWSFRELLESWAAPSHRCSESRPRCSPRNRTRWRRIERDAFLIENGFIVVRFTFKRLTRDRGGWSTGFEARSPAGAISPPPA